MFRRVETDTLGMPPKFRPIHKRNPSYLGVSQRRYDTASYAIPHTCHVTTPRRTPDISDFQPYGTVTPHIHIVRYRTAHTMSLRTSKLYHCILICISVCPSLLTVIHGIPRYSKHITDLPRTPAQHKLVEARLRTCHGVP